MPTESVSFGPSAVTADTKSLIGAETAMPKAGVIREIRVTAYQGVTDKADTAILTLDLNIQKGLQEFACAPCSHEITVGGRIPAEVIKVEIPFAINEKIKASLTPSESLEDVVVSLLYTV